jgi:uncharacterized protein YjbJ (UPF0337 family)
MAPDLLCTAEAEGVVLFRRLVGDLHLAPVRKETDMNWNQLRTRWPQMRFQLRHRWGRLTEEDLDVIAGQRDVFIGRVEERYSVVREEAQKRIEEWLRTLREEKILTGRA